MDMQQSVSSDIALAQHMKLLQSLSAILPAVAFSGRPGLRMVPSAIILMGSGSLINGLAAIMTDELNMAAQLWQIPAGECVSNGPEFAVAAALSAWEIDA